METNNKTTPITAEKDRNSISLGSDAPYALTRHVGSVLRKSSGHIRRDNDT